MGPTASGKTDLAVELVQRLPCDIISVDSAMVYRGLEIGTAKPDAELLARAPHRLIDFRDPAQPYSAATFAADARAHMEQIHAAGRIPLLVGGTMLYFRALEQGLSPLPQAEPAVREALDAQASQIGWPAMHARLAEADPASAQKIHPNDSQRIQRALEILQISGRSRTDSTGNRQSPAETWNTVKLVVAPLERSILHQRIALRFEQMMAAGFLSEVEKLHANPDLQESLPAIRAVGYRQLWQFLEGELTLDEAVERGIIATRQLARRQLTWLRAETVDLWIDALAENRTEIASDCIRETLGLGISGELP